MRCPLDCDCGKHSRMKCQPGCTCGKHSRASVIDWSDPEQRHAYNRQKARDKYAADPEPGREAARRWRAKNPGRHGRPQNIAANLRWKFNLTPDQVKELAAKQEGLCYLCNEPLDFERQRAVHIDHDRSCCRGNRSCGTCVRGLACGRCNAGIGHFGDDPERMRRVADNLEMANAALRGATRTVTPSEVGHLQAAPVATRE